MMKTIMFEGSAVDPLSAEVIYGPEEFCCEVTEALAGDPDECVLEAAKMIRGTLSHRMYLERDLREKLSGRSWVINCQPV